MNQIGRGKGVPTLKHLRNVIITNVLLILVLVASDYFQWFTINNYTTKSNIEIFWTPFLIHWNSFVYMPNGKNILDGFVLFFNYPFVIFLLATAVNLYFIIELGRSKETKLKGNQGA
jgi:hypothetical protein